MKEHSTWHSERLQHDLTLVRWGEVGVPVLLFPSAGGDCEEVERFGLVEALGDLLAGGRIKVYSLDSLNGRAWLDGSHPLHASWLQARFEEAVRHEVVPAIRADCNDPGIEIITAGPSIGAFNALEALCDNPDVFAAAVCMSGTYDLSKWLEGMWPDDFYHTSPIHYLPSLDEGNQLQQLRRRFVVLAHGSGRWENPSQSWEAARILGDRSIPNRVDDWGPGYSHDWETWRQMLPRYLAELTAGG